MRYRPKCFFVLTESETFLLWESSLSKIVHAVLNFKWGSRRLNSFRLILKASRRIAKKLPLQLLFELVIWFIFLDNLLAIFFLGGIKNLYLKKIMIEVPQSLKWYQNCSQSYIVVKLSSCYLYGYWKKMLVSAPKARLE